MKRLASLLIALAFCPPAPASGISRYRVDGVELRVEHAAGVEAGRLIARHLATRPRDPAGHAAVWQSRGGWRELASLNGRQSEVLQVRGARDSLEAILSIVDLDQRKGGRAALPIRWIPRTSVINHVGSLDDASAQWLLRSAWSPASLRYWMRLAATLGRWQLDREDATGLALSRPGEQLRVVVLSDRDGGGSVAVLTTWRRS